MEPAAPSWPEPPSAAVLRLPQSHGLAVLPPAERGEAATAWFRDVLAPSMPLRTLRISPWVGLYAWRTLEWDSERLGMETARILCLMACAPDDPAPPSATTLRETVDSGLVRARCLERVVREARASGVRYLFMRIDASDVDLLHQLEERGFRVVDGILTLARRVDPAVSPAEGFSWRLATPGDIPRLREIGAAIYRHDRFHVDPAIGPGIADRLHAEWLENSVVGRAADFVVVHPREGPVDAFVTCSIDRSLEPWLGVPHGTIVLVGTALQAARQGLARELTRASLAELGRRGVGWAQVGTQLSNIPASRLYEQCGFSLVASSLTLRILL